MKTIPTIAALSFAAALPAQMELRDMELFQRQRFEQQAPALGVEVPDLCLERVDGRPWSLAQQLGKSVVLIKASFT